MYYDLPGDPSARTDDTSPQWPSPPQPPGPDAAGPVHESFRQDLLRASPPNATHTTTGGETSYPDARGVLALVDALIDGLRTCDDPQNLRRRLALMDCLAPLEAANHLDETGLGDARAPVATLLLRCQRSRDRDYAWAVDACHTAGLPPLAILCAIGDQRRQDRQYPPQVANFRAEPHYYRLVPVTDLPPFHNPHQCDHDVAWEAAKQQATRRRFVVFGGRPTEMDARNAADARLASDFGRWCSKHDHEIDWDATLLRAVDIHGTVRPWTRENVYAAVNPTRREPLAPQTRLLSSLFLDPIVWDGRNNQLGNGQHRVCGARQAGLGTLLVATV